MANENLSREGNRKTVIAGIKDSSGDVFMLRVDEITGRLLVDVNGASTISDGDAVDGDDTGTLMLGTDGSNYQVLAVDSSGNLQVDIVSGGGGGTQYNEDDAHQSGDTGTMALAVRNDTLAALATTDGDYAPLQVNASGALFIQEGSALDVSAATVTVDLGSNNDVIQGTHDNFNANANVQQGNSDVGSGNPLEVTLANGSVPSHAVTNAGTFAVQVDGDALTALQLIDDAIYTDDAGITLGTSKGVGIMGFAGTQSVNANDAGFLAMDTDGALHISDGGNTITVDGTVTANLSGTDNAVLDTIDAVLDTINAKLVTGTDIGDVTINNSTGASAVNIQDGGNTITVDGTVTANLSSTDNTVLDTIDTVLDTINAKLVSGTTIGDIEFGESLPAGTNTVGGAFPVASTSGTGTSTYYDADLDETKIEVTDNATVMIYSIQAFNTTAAPLFLQLFDLDADSVTVGSTTPTNQYVIPGNADSDGAGFIITFPVPKAYTTGFTVACTTNSEGNSAPGAGACIVNIEYKD